MMNKMILSAVMAAVLTLSGCGQSSTPTSSSSAPAAPAAASTAPQGTSDLLDTIREKGEIVVAMEGTWAPWTYHDESDALMGYDVEVAQRIAEELGVTATFVEGEWDGLLAGLDAGRYDMMVNGVSITEERAQKYDFSVPYAFDRMAVIVRGDNTDITSFEALSGKTTANTISSIYATLAESYGATVTGVDDLNQTFELLFSGRIDATLNAEVTYYDYRKAHPDANLKIAVLSEDATPIAIPLRKGEETAALRAEIDRILGELAASGELATLSQKYFGSDISSATAVPVEVVPDASSDQSNSLSANPASSEATAPTESLPTTASSQTAAVSQSPAATELQIQVRNGERTVVFALNGSSAARALYDQLPLTIAVEDYGSNEKITYPPEKLDTSDTPLLSSGASGTLGYYAPWGDVIFFYDSCGPASGLYTLGSAVSGAEQIAAFSGTVQMEAYTS